MKDEDIDAVENYIRSQLPGILDSIAVQSNRELNYVEKSFIFGKFYALNPSKFSFVHGEKMLIEEIANYIKNKTNEEQPGDKCLEHPGKIASKYVVQTAVGSIYGNINEMRKVKNKSCGTISVDLKSKLLKKAQLLTKNFRKSSDKNVPDLIEDMIAVDANDPERVIASVQCVFCQKKIRIRFKRSLASGSWIISNLKSHLTSCTNPIRNKKFVRSCDSDVDKSYGSPEDDSTTSDIENTNCLLKLDIQPDPRISHFRTKDYSDHNIGQTDEFTSQLNALETQMIVQNVRMANSITQNAETESDCDIMLDSSTINVVKVCKITGDGNCLFGAISHQLNGMKIDSDEHKKSAIQMRNDVITHIKNNLSQYEFDIKGRIFEKYPGRIITDLKKDCIWYIDRFLAPKTAFGGTESLKAISIIHKVNIIVFSEKGHAYFGYDYHPEYHRCVMIAFRITSSKANVSNTNRKHYDTVVKLNKEIISAQCKPLLQSQNKLKLMKNNENSLVDLT